MATTSETVYTLIGDLVGSRQAPDRTAVQAGRGPRRTAFAGPDQASVTSWLVAIAGLLLIQLT